MKEQPSLHSLVAWIRSEYREMPGLRLTFAQACRLWDIDSATCELLLQQLMRDGFLWKTPKNTYMATPAGVPT
jgi:hypothetical protein